MPWRASWRSRSASTAARVSWSRPSGRWYRDRHRVRCTRGADGNTLGIISNSFVVLPYFRKLNYDPLKDFVPICELANLPPLLVVNNASPYRTLKDFIDAAHARPGTLTLGTIGPATSAQLAFEMLKLAAKADITFVPFTGYTPAIQQVLGRGP